MPRNSPRRDQSRRAKAVPAGECPCGSGEPYAVCCGVLHEGLAKATTAEQLMRSRYSAFAVRNTPYLLRSWHSSTRPATLDLDPAQRWRGLTVLGTTDGTTFHTEGTVEFEARYTDHGEDGLVRENSFFSREDGDWVYVRAL